MYFLFMAHQLDMGAGDFNPVPYGVWYQIANNTAVR